MGATAFSKRTCVGTVVLAALLGLSACLPVPLGDPEKAKIDPRLVGVWQWRDDDATVHLAVFRPFDDRTYAVDTMTGTMAADGVMKPASRNVFKGWLTTVKGETFLTLQ